MSNVTVVNNVTQDHVQSEFFHNGQVYQGNVKGLVKLCQVLKGQRNALKLALQWGLQRGLISSQNNQKAPLMAALAAIASEEPQMLKKAVLYAESYAPFLVFTWQDKISAKGIITVDDKAAPEIAYKPIDVVASRKLVARLEAFLTWKAPKAEKVVTPVTEKQAESLAARLDISDQKAQETVINKLLTGKTPASAALAALDGIKEIAVKQVFTESEKASLLAAIEGLAKHLQPVDTAPEQADTALNTALEQAKAKATPKAKATKAKATPKAVA